MHYLAIEPALRPEIHIEKLIYGKDMSNVKSLDALGVYLEIIYADLPAPHAMHFPEDIRGLWLTDEIMQMTELKSISKMAERLHFTQWVSSICLRKIALSIVL